MILQPFAAVKIWDGLITASLTKVLPVGRALKCSSECLTGIVCLGELRPPSLSWPFLILTSVLLSQPRPQTRAMLLPRSSRDQAQLFQCKDDSAASGGCTSKEAQACRNCSWESATYTMSALSTQPTITRHCQGLWRCLGIPDSRPRGTANQLQLWSR